MLGTVEEDRRQKLDHAGYIMELALYYKNKEIPLKGFT